MLVESFRLESFRPWNPFQDKVQPLRDPLDIYRYPSPVSISATPSPSDPSDTALKSRKVHSKKFDRHPLPARPPVEVCLDGGLHSEAQYTRHEPKDLGRAASAGNHAEDFDPEDILQVQDLPESEDLGSPTLTASTCLDAERRSPGFGPCDLEYAIIAGQDPQGVDSENPILTREPQGLETIDPAILNGPVLPCGGQIQATENITSIARCPGKCPLECSGFPNQDPPLKCKRHNAERTRIPGRQFLKPNKRSTDATRHSKNGAGRSKKGPGRRKNVSFPTVRAQFSALPVEDRLQFLSWLFEGALSHCVSTRADTDIASVTRCASSQDVDVMTHDCDRQSSNTDLVEAEDPPSRKGLTWSREEIHLLVNLREEHNLTWSEVARLFARKFPGRSKGSLQVYWSTTLKKQRLSLEDVA